MVRTLASRFLWHCIALAVLGSLGQARAADPDTAESGQPALDGLYFDWSLYEMQENGNRVCYLSSGLERSSDSVPRRRPAVVLVTNRPAEGKKGVVSVYAGFPYDEGSTVLMSIGRRQFHLLVSGGTAWAEDSDDLQILAAIRGGSTLVVTGRMKNGPTTTDTFSLKGFGPALSALDQDCPMPGGLPHVAAVHKGHHGKPRKKSK
jgi:invasion protein IalB